MTKLDATESDVETVYSQMLEQTEPNEHIFRSEVQQILMLMNTVLDSAECWLRRPVP